MNKQEAISKIMRIKAVLPERLQTELIESVKVLATFKMISVDDDMPYNHPQLLSKRGIISFGPQCVVLTEDGVGRIDNMASDIYGLGSWHWQDTDEELHGTITDWLPLKSLRGSQIMDELGNELKIE